MTLPAFEYYPCGLNNAATSQIQVNSVVIPIFINNCKFVFLFILYNIAFSDKKISLCNLYIIRERLNNAATSRILINDAVIPIL